MDVDFPVLILNIIITLSCIILGIKYVSLKRFDLKKMKYPLIFTLLLLLGEGIYSFYFTHWGIIIYVLLIILAVLSPLFIEERNTVLVIQSFILFALLRLVNSGLPLDLFLTHYQFQITYSILLPAAMLLAYHQGFDFRDLGLIRENILKNIILGLILGFILGTTEFLILSPGKIIPYYPFVSASTFFILGFTEELLYRGIFLTNTLKVTNSFYAILLTSIIFSAMHSIWLKPMEIAFTFYVGMVFGIIFYVSRSLITPITAHFIINFVLFQILPYYEFL